MAWHEGPPASKEHLDEVTVAAQRDLLRSLEARLQHAVHKITELEIALGVDKRALLEENERLRRALREQVRYP
jgi:hypothetical protein